MVKAALRSAYGEEIVEQQVSTYYLSDEIAGTYRGMRIAIANAEWGLFRELSSDEVANLLWEWAGMLDLSLPQEQTRSEEAAAAARARSEKAARLHRSAPRSAMPRILAP